MVYGRHSRMGWTPVASGIAGSISADPAVTGALTAVWVDYLLALGTNFVQADPTFPIPAGSEGRFYASCTATVASGTAWSIAITVIDLFDNALWDYGIASTKVSADLGQTGKLCNVKHNTPWVMPAHIMQLSWHLFASFDSTADTSLLDSGDPTMYY